ncbi:apolipoprotein B-100-like [Thalassophryne amazonica]|uniref:apolipoprotein B-100-like n=1 Tax=Thalassophryne amazonica TaxID=390379 RepID=UPI001472489F|nr:apolipoprotein B-100-like [Thalassophryne amazonica]
MEINHVDDDGQPVYQPAVGADAFKTSMARNPLKVTVEGQVNVKLFPKDDEPVNILNIKRGIVSALIVPVVEEEKNKEMATVHGLCVTDFAVNSRQDIATDVTVSRDLSKCDSFTAHRQHTSPLALLSSMNSPLSKLISSTQTCNYKFDNQKKHMTSGTCTERHLFLPFSHQNEYGISTLIKQTLTLKETTMINDRTFDHDEANLKFLPMEDTDNKSPMQTKDAAIAAMQELNTVSQTTEGEKRASVFLKLVSELRGLNADVLGPTALEMMDISESLTWQALLQCGTPECTSAMMGILRTFDTAALEVDAAVYALALLPNPSRLFVKDMLAMAKYKQSKSIMYALSNAVRKLYRVEGHATPEITAVSEFIASLLGADCAGDKDQTFLTLRVVGNMGDAMEAADPAIKTMLLKCMRQPSTVLSVQLAAIQAFRRMSITDEVRSNLQRVSQYAKGAVQKRLAAYLILMRDPQNSDIKMVMKMLKEEQNEQVKAFVTSHIYNILSSTDPETEELSEKIREALQNADLTMDAVDTSQSHNYKLKIGREGLQANIDTNVVFDSSSQLPREVLLETTLKVFDFKMDLWEVGMEGKGFETSIEALFGKNGFFPDTVSKALYWAEDKMPTKIKQFLRSDTQRPEGQKIPENLVKEVLRNFNKLTKDLQSQESPEAMAYLRIMGTELGYIKGSDLRFISENAKMYAEIFLKIIPTQVLTKLISSTDNKLFAHYMFMDYKFTLSTASGLPLTFALSGTFAPGAKGGLRMIPKMHELSFMPSVGIEFVTKMGVHVPEFVISTVEMHTNMYHESAVNAKITMDRNQIKLSIPAPKTTTKFLEISNKVLVVGAGHASEISAKRGKAFCDYLFNRISYCTETHHSEADDNTKGPYFPLAGENSYSVHIKPSKQVSEYTATIFYDLLHEGKDGRQKVDTLKMTLRAEGLQPTEATMTMKYNRNRSVFTTQIQIPDFDVEAGMKVSLTDSAAKGKSLTLEISNKNVPQLSLIGRAKLHTMADDMLQVQLLIPSLKTDAAITATMNQAEGLTMELKSDIKLPETSSIQAVKFNYGEEQAVVQLVSNTNADTKILVSLSEALQIWFGEVVEGAMEQQVVNTDMKFRHIFNKGLEASNIWMNKITNDVPRIKALRNSLPELKMPSMPEKLFMNLESTFKYQFSQHYGTISIPLPLGGTSSDELSMPLMAISSHIPIPQMDVPLHPKYTQIPSFTIPSQYDLTVPLMGMMEFSTKVNNNYYNWEGMASAGYNTVESPSFMANFKVKAESPIEVLSFTAEGATAITDTTDETLKFTIDASMKHKLMETSVGVLETFAISSKVLSTGSYKIETSSTLGLQSSLAVTSQFSVQPYMFTGDANMDGSLSVGSMTGTTTYSHSFSVEPVKKEARLESTLSVTSPILTVAKTVKGSYIKEQLLIESNTNMNSGPVKHTTEIGVSYKDAHLSMKSVSVTKAEKRILRSNVELAASRGNAIFRIENQADDTENRAYMLLSGFLKTSGMEINADASVNIFSTRASHKATLALTGNDLTTSCTTTAQHNPMTFENVFHGALDYSGATMSITTKGAFKDHTVNLNVEGKLASTEVSLNSKFKGNLYDLDTLNTMNLRVSEEGFITSSKLVGSFKNMKTESTHSLSFTPKSFELIYKSDNVFDKRNSYMHDFAFNIEHFTASIVLKNDLKVIDVNFVNDAQFKAEPYNMELTGVLTGRLSEEELKHTYEVKFVDMTFTTKCNTNGKLLGSQITHATDMEVVGLSTTFNSISNINSPYLKLESNVKTFAKPFVLHIDAMINSNGAVYLYGEQSGELYSKFLLKAEPLLFTNSFDYRASTTHELESGTIKTILENKFNSELSLDEQSVMLKMESKVNENAFNQEMKAYNNPEMMGIHLKGAVSTSLFSENHRSHDYAIFGFVKYDKNSESHSILVPFIEHLPAVIDNAMSIVMGLIDGSIEMLTDIDAKYELSMKFHNKMAELKEVIDTFDFKLYIQELKKFIRSVENFIIELTAKFPSEKIINGLKTIKETIMAWLKKHNTANKISVIYVKIEEILSSYEVEKVINAIMDEIVKIMKQYQVREKIQFVFDSLRSTDIQFLLEKTMAPVKDLVNELHAFDFKQLIGDISDYFIRMVQKIKSFDYDTFTIQMKEKVADISQIPCFGKLQGGFSINSPHYNLRTTADLQNTTTIPDTPKFQVNVNSEATSTLRVLDHTISATAQFSIPEMSHLAIDESIEIDQSCFTLDHQGSMTFYGLSAKASAKTIANTKTEVYVANLTSNAVFSMGSGLSTTIETTYNHDFNMPALKISNEASFSQKSVLVLEGGTAQLNINNQVNGKHEVLGFSDEMSHNSDMEVVMDLHGAKVTFTGSTGGSHFKMKQNLNADICIFRHVIVDAKIETKAPFVANSVAQVKVQAKVEDLKVDITASHNTELVGRVDGSVSNSALVLVTPSEFTFDTKNKGNAKIVLPLRLSGKIDLQNDFSLILNSEEQQVSWTGLSRFNQYKYAHYFNVYNGDREIQMHSQITGEANLDVLKEPISIPEMTLPFFYVRTPKVVDYSLWEDTGLSYLLKTTHQTFDMNSKLKYKKNPKMITIDINVEPVINAINTNAKLLRKKMLIGKDQASAIFATSYGKAKAAYEKYRNELPKSIIVPFMNAETSTFTVPLPDLSHVTMPSLQVPSAFSKLTLPKITPPKVRAINIPVMGDLIYEFNMKTAVITLKTEGSIYNHDKITVSMNVSSTSEFQCLNGKIEGNTNMYTDDGLTIISVLSLKHSKMEAKHDSTISITKHRVDTSITNSAKVHLPSMKVELHQEILANPEEGLVLSMSMPSAGVIAVQMQTKHPAQVNARLYGRYPSELTKDVEILAVKMSVINAEKLNLQTTWDMELPNEMLVGLKKYVPAISAVVAECTTKTYNKMSKYASYIEGPFDRARKQTKVMFKTAADKFAGVQSLSQGMTVVTDRTVWIFKEYQKKIEKLFDAIVKFLRETKFKVPGYEHKLSGLEMYQKFSVFVAEFSEDAIETIPEYFISTFSPALDYFSATEFTFPGSNHILSGEEILNDLSVALKKIQAQMIIVVRKLGSLQLEDIMKQLSEIMQLTIAKGNQLLHILKTHNSNLSSWVMDIYNDAVNSRVMEDITHHVGKALRIILQYVNTVKAKIRHIFADVSIEQFQADIQSKIDSLAKHLNVFHNNIIEFLEDKSKCFTQYVKVSERQMEIDVPFPFIPNYS